MSTMNLSASEASRKWHYLVTQQGLLELAAHDVSQSVYVVLVSDGSSQVVGFAAGEGGPFFTEGFSWQYDRGSNLPLRVTFKFSQDIASVDCDELEYSASSNGQQLMSIPATESDYDFDINLTGGAVSNSKIHVQPVNNPTLVQPMPKLETAADPNSKIHVQPVNNPTMVQPMTALETATDPNSKIPVQPVNNPTVKPAPAQTGEVSTSGGNKPANTPTDTKKS